ncbi:MAG: peptidase M14 family protein, partial [Candidatus Bathyarchaeota archaeon]|nr:peptidase M14 family protein [Candidatus Bathyarchaeota archaeon]
DVKQLRIAMYQRYYGGNIDEGWTRFVLEQFEFPYRTVFDKEIKEGLKDIDVLILPSDSEAMITGEKIDESYAQRGMMPPMTPPEYLSGIGKEGVESLKTWIKEGGNLLCFNASSDFAIKNMGLNVKNVLEGIQSKDFYCPGSTLWATVNTTHPLGHGMLEGSLLFFWNSPVFEVKPGPDNDKVEVVVEYPQRDILQSGWLIGEDKIKRKAAMVSVKLGKGKVVLYGFRPQHRAQTHGTFKLLFNGLIG